MTQVTEHQKVAALVCMDIDTIYAAAKNHPDKAMDFLELLKAKKDDVVDTPSIRDSRYAATCNIFSIAVHNSEGKK